MTNEALENMKRGIMIGKKWGSSRGVLGKKEMKNCSRKNCENVTYSKGIICKDLSCHDGNAKHINLRPPHFFLCCVSWGGGGVTTDQD